MERTHDDECRYCDQDRHGGWIYCRSCGRLLSRDQMITVRAEATRASSAARTEHRARS